MIKCSMVFSGLDDSQARWAADDQCCDVKRVDHNTHVFFSYFDLHSYVVYWTHQLMNCCFSMSEKVQLVRIDLINDAPEDG